MFGFIELLNFSSFLAHVANQTKCLSENDEPCMVRPILIYLNSVELKCYPFMVSQDKCSGSCNSGNDLSSEIRVQSKTRHKCYSIYKNIRRIYDKNKRS